MTEVVVAILDNLRYIDIEGTFQALCYVYKTEQDVTCRKQVLTMIEHLAGYNMQVWRQVGLGVQFTLATAIERLSSADRADRRRVLLAVWRQFLNSEITGTTTSADALTFSRAALPASKGLARVRESAINGLVDLLDRASSEADKREVLSSLWGAMRLPPQANCSNELCALVLSDAKRIVELLSKRVAGQPYQLIEHMENKLLHEYRWALKIAAADQDSFGCKELANNLASAILEFRDIVNADGQFVLYKTLVGFDCVFPHHWEDDKFDFDRDDQYRQRRAEQFVQSITVDNQDEWFSLIEQCAATKSNDIATFPTFAAFLGLLAKQKPDIAAGFVERANDDLLAFLPAFLNGLFESGASDTYLRIIETQLAKATHLSAIAVHLFEMRTEIPHVANRVARQGYLNWRQHRGDPLLGFGHQEPQRRPSTSRREILPPCPCIPERQERFTLDTRRLVYARGRTFFPSLSADQTELVLDNLLPTREFNDEIESVLSSIAQNHAEAVWNFLGRRLSHNREHQEESYEAIPYQARELGQQLSNDAQLAARIVRSWYRADDKFFRFRGARLLRIVFPDFPQAFANELSQLVAAGSDDDIGFVLDVLQCYEGCRDAWRDQGTH